MKPNFRKVLEMALEEGVRYGYNRAHKHIENPTEGIGSTQDRSYPDDMWKVIDYAEAMGLQTRIDLLPVNHIADTAVSRAAKRVLVLG